MPDKASQVIVYLRPHADGDLPKQLERIKEYASRHNLEIGAVKVEEPAADKAIVLSEILSGIKNQKYPHLLVWDLFSLAASPALLDSIFALFARSSSHLTIVKDQLSTVDGKELVFGVARSILRYAATSRRLMIKEGQRRARKAGKALGRPGMTAKNLAEAADLRAKGLSYRQVARLLKLDESTVRKNLNKSLKNLVNI